MESIINKIRKSALELSPTERASLAHDLILSLEDESSVDLSPEYEAEIRRRVKLAKDEKAEGQPAESNFAEIENKYR